jgi:hypothetical protein
LGINIGDRKTGGPCEHANRDSEGFKVGPCFERSAGTVFRKGHGKV